MGEHADTRRARHRIDVLGRLVGDGAGLIVARSGDAEGVPVGGLVELQRGERVALKGTKMHTGV
jgi:hypothetical protein